MENIYYEVVTGEMSAFFEENGFKEKDGIFVNEVHALKIQYDEDKQLYNLFCAEVNEEQIGEYSLISSYLFDQGQNKSDAVSVGIDFVDSARKKLGIKAQRKSISSDAQLPTAKNSNVVNVSTLTAKLLANYPDLKETYKEQVTAKGKYLYLDFSTTYFVPEIRKTIDSNNKKAIKKLLDMFSEIFVSGDKASVNLVIALLSSAIGKNPDRFKTVSDRLTDCPHLITALNQEIAVLAKNKKLQKALNFQD